MSVPLMQDAIGKAVVMRLQSISHTTENLAPNWKFFVDGSKCNLELAKRSLLGSSVSTSLGKQVTAHRETLASISAAFSKWGLPEPSQYEVTKYEIKQSMGILNYGGDTVAVIAAVSVLTPPPAQRAMLATALLSAGLPGTFPASLKKEFMNAKQKKQ